MYRNVDECRFGRKIEVPQVMMHELLLPDEPAACRVERQERVCETIVADASAPVEVRARRARGHEYQTAILIDRHHSPRIGARSGGRLGNLPSARCGMGGRIGQGLE